MNALPQDTKPKKKRKEPLSRADYHNVIVAYVAIVLSVISLFVDVIQAFPRESIQILRAEDDGYYHFDGETLFKNFQVTVANNSAIPVSVVEITIERDGEARTFEGSDVPGVLPLNMESNHTEIITVPWEIPYFNRTHFLNISMLRNAILKNSEEIKSQVVKSDILISSRLGQSPEDLRLRHLEIYFRKTLPLSITLYTAKENQYALKTEDIGAPELASNDSEGDWVGRLFVDSITLTEEN